MGITGGIERHAEERNNFDHRASGNLLFELVLEKISGILTERIQRESKWEK